ncbi:MAG: hypothetical protein NTX50_12650 [Candidatus Sumerlaeota bacterium]|nr:hypothetical protein [Candidatus Sumerlaeota bacterium]
MLAVAQQKLVEINSVPPVTVLPQTMADGASSERGKPDGSNNDNEKKVTRNAEERSAAAIGGPVNVDAKPEPAGVKKPQNPPRHRPQKRRR